MLCVALINAADNDRDASKQAAASVCAAANAPFAIVHVRSKAPGREDSWGTGVLLADERVLTASHVLQCRQGGTPPQLEIVFGGRNGQAEFDGAAGRSLSITLSDDWPGADTGQLLPNGDLAIIGGVNVPKWATGVTLAKNTPVKGDVLTSVGLEAPSAVRVHVAAMIGKEEPVVTQWSGRHFRAVRPYLRIGVTCDKGDSGGPVFNQRGELVGINTATSDYSDIHLEEQPSTRIQFTGGSLEYGGGVKIKVDRHRHTSITDLSQFNELLRRKTK